MLKKNPMIVSIVLCIGLIALGVGGGYLLGNNNSSRKIKEQVKLNDNRIDDGSKIKTSLVDESVITVTTNFIYKVKYTECGHEVVKNEKPKDDMIGLNRKELQAYVQDNLVDWNMSLFSKEEVILISEKGALCPKHFVVGEVNGKIAIFKINENGEKVVHKIFKDTTTTILREENQEKLKKGIVVDSEEEAIQILENFIT